MTEDENGIDAFAFAKGSDATISTTPSPLAPALTLPTAETPPDGRRPAFFCAFISNSRRFRSRHSCCARRIAANSGVLRIYEHCLRSSDLLKSVQLWFGQHLRMHVSRIVLEG